MGDAVMMCEMVLDGEAIQVAARVENAVLRESSDWPDGDDRNVDCVTDCLRDVMADEMERLGVDDAAHDYVWRLAIDQIACNAGWDVLAAAAERFRGLRVA